jgi:outer membrane murein-binding lipoprotein Lpp
MKPHRITALAVAGLLLAGCRSGGNNELVERELRWQEDQIYELEDALDSCESQLESAQRENAALKKELGGGDRDRDPQPLSTPMLDFPSGPAAPARGNRPNAKQRTAAPLVEPGVEIDPGEEFTPDIQAEGASSSKRITDQRVDRIVLNKQLTGGSNHSGRGGDAGVLVVFEPRNRAGQLLQVPGDVSIAVLDPTLQGPQSRVARWDFTAQEAGRQFKKTALGRGFHFELPWAGEPPTNKKLRLYVRYVAPDGRKLLTDMNIDIAPPTNREARSWRSVPTGSRRTQAPPFDAPPDTVRLPRTGPESTTPSPVPTARFLDPPMIVAGGDEPDAGAKSPGGATDEDDKPARPKKPADARTARPIWTPYR